MEKQISRRGFLKKGAIALGSVALCDLTCLAGLGQVESLGSSTSELKETTMPHISVKLYPGRSEQQKVQLAEAIVKDVVSIIKCGEDSVSVAIEEIQPQDWAEKVYKPEIQNKWDKLYKKPGYSM